jgi:hypothetical protein
MLSAGIKTLETLADKNFIWTQNNGKQITQQQLFEQLGSGQLKYSKMETTNVTVSVYGDTAVVRGSISSESGGSGEANSFTLTFVNIGGAWKAVAMHTSRP